MANFNKYSAANNLRNIVQFTSTAFTSISLYCRTIVISNNFSFHIKRRPRDGVCKTFFFKFILFIRKHYWTKQTNTYSVILNFRDIKALFFFSGFLLRIINSAGHEILFFSSIVVRIRILLLNVYKTIVLLFYALNVITFNCFN